MTRAQMARKDMTAEPLIIGLVKLLPPEGEPFPPHRRQAWLLALKINLDLIYGDSDPSPEPDKS